MKSKDVHNLNLRIAETNQALIDTNKVLQDCTDNQAAIQLQQQIKLYRVSLERYRSELSSYLESK